MVVNLATTMATCRVYHDDPSAVHQLQDEVCGSPPVEDVDLQSFEHVH